MYIGRHSFHFRFSSEKPQPLNFSRVVAFSLFSAIRFSLTNLRKNVTFTDMAPMSLKKLFTNLERPPNPSTAKLHQLLHYMSFNVTRHATVKLIFKNQQALNPQFFWLYASLIDFYDMPSCIIELKSRH